jgi:hypothetical protein
MSAAWMLLLPMGNYTDTHWTVKQRFAIGKAADVS